MDTRQQRGSGTLTEVPRGSENLTRTYSEADIAWLEGQDLTEPAVLSALHRAYEQHDPKEREFVGFAQSAGRYMNGTEVELRGYIEEANAVLKADPKDYRTRLKRMYAMAGLACARKREAAGAAA